MNATGRWGIAGQAGATNETLTIRNATVTAQGSSGSICDIFKLTLDNVAITSPTGAAYDSSLQGVALNGNVVTDIVAILPLTYGIKIAGAQVTHENYNNLSVINGVSGTVRFDPFTKTLTLEDATIDASKGRNAILHGIPNLTILLKGSNNIKGAMAALEATASTTIKGAGSLNITSPNECGIYIVRSTLTIEDCTVDITARWGIAGPNGDNPRENVVIRGATVSAQGSDGSICDINNLTLDNVAITSPNGAAYDSSLKSVALNGTVVTDRVEIMPLTYGIEIAGTPVTPNNCNDLSVIDGVSGTVKYDPLTRTLTLDNATIQANNENATAISSSYYLTILVTGTNYIKSPHNGLEIKESTTIKGEGTLNIECTGFAINTLAPNLTIEDCTVITIGKYGILGSTDKLNGLTMRNATVAAQGSSGSIVNISELTLSGSTFTSPATATFDKSKKTVVDNGVTVTNLVIQPTTLYDVVLDWYGVNKIRVIKVLTDKYGYSLSKAKNIVENTPSIAGTGMHKLDAIEMRDALTAAGGIHSSATIHPEGTWTSINSTETVVPTYRPGIYNMQGVKMTRNWDALPSGLYIVDGVKRIKK